MTLDQQAVLTTLRSTWPDVDIEQIRPLTGGQWATMAHVSVTGAPADVPGELVVRVMPDAELGAKEVAVQAAAAEAGIPTPRVRLVGGSGGALGDAWVVMDFAPGASLLGGLDAAAAVRTLPRMLRRLPLDLADTMAAVHDVDVAPVIAAVSAAAPGVALHVDDLWEHFHAAAALHARADLAAALVGLRREQPASKRQVLCHGDLHPFNLLTSDRGPTILDWTGAIIAPPAYDVAFTWLLLRHPPLDAPAALRPVISGAAAILARRFVHHYRDVDDTADLGDLAWYAALHAMRMLVDVAVWRSTDDPRADVHPSRLVVPAARRIVERASGVPLESTPPHSARL